MEIIEVKKVDWRQPARNTACPQPEDGDNQKRKDWRQPVINATCPQPEDGNHRKRKRLAVAGEKRRLPPA
jgi:hypothetical protein